METLHQSSTTLGCQTLSSKEPDFDLQHARSLLRETSHNIDRLISILQPLSEEVAFNTKFFLILFKYQFSIKLS